MFLKKIDFSLIIVVIAFIALGYVCYNLYETVHVEKVRNDSDMIQITKEEPGPETGGAPALGSDYTDIEAAVEDTPAADEQGVTYVAILIDDVGASYSLAEKFISLDTDFTFSVLPNEHYSDKLAALIHEKGYETMLHLPMEPYGYPEKKNPGDGALLVSMSDDEIAAKAGELLDRFPMIAGTNNHMGSRFSEACEKASVVMSEIKERKLYFLDSLTSARSCLSEVAKSYNIPNIKRNIFLDNEKAEDKIVAQINKLIKLSKKYGYAIAICHPYPETFTAFSNNLHLFEENGVKIKRLSEIIKMRSLRIKKAAARATVTSSSTHK